MTEFELESQMIEPVMSWLKSKRLKVKPEFQLPWGTCDLMAGSPIAKHIRTRIAQGQRFPVGSLFRARLLLQIPDDTRVRGVTLAGLQNRYGSLVDPARIVRELEILELRRFISVSASGSYKKINGWLPLHKNLIAVELKLSRVSEAIHQAIINKPAVKKSYVALPSRLANRIVESPKICEFVDNGIGLISVSKNECNIFLEAMPRDTDIDLSVQLYCADRLLIDSIKDTSA